MSPQKFASITASILARKGEAKPWEDPPKRALDWKDEPRQPAPAFEPPIPAQKYEPVVKFTPVFEPAASPARKPEPAASPPFTEVKASVVRRDPSPVRDVEFSDMSAAAQPHAFDEPEKIKKCTIRMTLHDYERLGIIAVKRNVTRQHLLHDALDQFFAAAADQYRKDCACLNQESCCQD